jgi:hypothetical protein
MGLTLFSRLAKWAAKHNQFSQNGVFTRTEFQALITPFWTAPKRALSSISRATWPTSMDALHICMVCEESMSIRAYLPTVNFNY